MADFTPEVCAVLDGRTFFHLATVAPDGSPHTVPVWMLREDHRLAFFTQPASRKAKHLAGDPRVSVSVVDESNPYRNVHLRGRVAEVLEGDDALVVIDRLSDKYIGQPFPMRTGNVYWIEAESVRLTELPFQHA
jgi:PPOX class probable F420-dependent enzyme